MRGLARGLDDRQERTPAGKVRAHVRTGQVSRAVPGAALMPGAARWRAPGRCQPPLPQPRSQPQPRTCTIRNGGPGAGLVSGTALALAELLRAGDSPHLCDHAPLNLRVIKNVWSSGGVPGMRVDGLRVDCRRSHC